MSIFISILSFFVNSKNTAYSKVLDILVHIHFFIKISVASKSVYTISDAVSRNK